MCILILTSCGSKQVFTHNELNALHLNTRLNHSTILLQSKVKIEKLVQETIGLVESGKSADTCLVAWLKLDRFVHETTAMNKIYSDQFITNEKTSGLVINIIQSSKRMIMIQDDLDDDIQQAIIAGNKVIATQRLRDLQVLYNTELDVILKANETYMSLATSKKK